MCIHTPSSQGLAESSQGPAPSLQGPTPSSSGGPAPSSQGLAETSLGLAPSSQGPTSSGGQLLPSRGWQKHHWGWEKHHWGWLHPHRGKLHLLQGASSFLAGAGRNIIGAGRNIIGASSIYFRGASSYLSSTTSISCVSIWTSFHRRLTAAFTDILAPLILSASSWLLCARLRHFTRLWCQLLQISHRLPPWQQWCSLSLPMLLNRVRPQYGFAETAQAPLILLTGKIPVCSLWSRNLGQFSNPCFSFQDHTDNCRQLPDPLPLVLQDI
jgi:hypothetical protein